MRDDPFLDEDMIEFAAGIRPEALVHGGRTKALLRMAFEGLLPDYVRLRTDKALFMPAVSRVFTAMGGLAGVSDLASLTALEDLGIARGRQYGAEFKAALESGTVDWLAFWCPLACEAFARTQRGAIVAA
jgi:hypothetical protein